MPPRRRVRGNLGIGQGRPVANAVLLEEIRHLRERMEAMETTQRRDPDDRNVSDEEESSDEEEEEDTEENKSFHNVSKGWWQTKG
jgi:hypothetical protein